jgi:hypothetical protein
MALTEIKGGLFLPWLYMYPTLAAGAIDLTAAGHKMAWVFRCPKTGTLEGFGWYSSLNTVLNAASVIRHSFQNVNAANGEPDGVQDEYKDLLGSAIAASTWIDADPMTDTGLVGGNKRVVTKGDLLAAVVEFQSFTAADVLGFVIGNAGQYSLANAFPYPLADLGAGYVKDDGEAAFALQYDDGSYEPVSPGLWPITTLSIVSFNTGSVPDEIGIKIVPPFPATVTGFWGRIDSVAGAAWDVILYDKDDVVKASLSLTRLIVNSGGNSMFHYFNNEVQLNLGEIYRLVVKPTNANNVKLHGFNVPAGAYLDGLSGGSAVTRAYRTDGGAWSEDVTRRPLLALALSHFESDVPFVSPGRAFMRGMVR